MNYLEKTKTMTGLEIIQAIQDGDLAPPAIGVLMGFKLLEVKDKLLRTSFVNETFSDEIVKLLDLKRTLTNE